MSIALPERLALPAEDRTEAIAVPWSTPIPRPAGERLAAQLRLKRAMDIVISLAALIVLSPIVVAVAVAIKVDSSGPVLYRQRRLGRHGKGFWLLKFRTMHRGSDSRLDEIIHLNEASGPWFKTRNDPRVTRVGRLLRSHYLDELPQLVNVLRGDMSLVGPRPCLDSELSAHPDELWFRLSVPQGMTGPWQINGHHALSFEEHVRVEREYVRSWSFAGDLAILVGTLGLVLRRTGY